MNYVLRLVSAELCRTVGGDGPRCDSNWVDFNGYMTAVEKRRVVGTLVEIAVNVVMGTHVYEFCGKYFVQRDGGLIGLRSTASLASLIMKLWDTAWVKLLQREEIQFFEYMRYVDDCRQCMEPFCEGWRWVDGGLQFKVEWEVEDLMSNETDQQRTAKELVKAMNSLVSYLQFEVKESSQFEDNKPPTLDTAIWHDEESNQVLFSFYEKPSVPNRGRPILFNRLFLTDTDTDFFSITDTDI